MWTDLRTGTPPPLLRCGPLVRHVSGRAAVLWVELAESQEVEVRLWATSPHRSSRPLSTRGCTAQVGDSHYAWIACRFLLPGTWYEYEVYARGLGGGWTRLWPDHRLTTIARPSVFRTLPSWSLDRVRMAHGSCRFSDSALVGNEKDRGVDALRQLAERLDRDWDDRSRAWPHLFLFSGDQVYVDDLADPVRRELRTVERSVGLPGRASTFRQYAAVYREAWAGTPQVRWLLSVLPSFMIFDDHEIGDDWNMTQEWVAAHQNLSWRRVERDGLLAYWIYQGAGNMSPDDWQRDDRMRPLVPRMRRLSGDVTRRLEMLFDSYASGVHRPQWGVSFDAAGTRVVLADTRTRRKLSGRRLLMDDQSWQDFTTEVKGTPKRNVLLVLPAPLLTQHRLHALLSIAGAYLEHGSAPGDPLRHGPGLDTVMWLQYLLPGLVQKYIREEAIDGPDAELWASFPDSFDRMLGLLEDLYDGRGTLAKNFVGVLSGDVHHSFVMRGELNDSARRARFLNITCSPIRRVDGSKDKKRDIYNGTFTYELLRLFTTPPYVAEQRRRCRWYPLTRPDGKYRNPIPLDDWAFWGTFVGWIEFEGSRVRYAIQQASDAGLTTVLEGRHHS